MLILLVVDAPCIGICRPGLLRRNSRCSAGLVSGRGAGIRSIWPERQFDSM